MARRTAGPGSQRAQQAVKWTILAEGRLRERGLRDLADDYLKRIRRHVRCEEIEVRDDAALRRALPQDSWLVVLEVTGQSHSSTAFAAQLERWSAVRGGVTFVIGGADGLPEDVVAKSNATLSLSTMTLPHRLARILLLEQLYRGLSILHREPYAREG